MRKNNVHNCRYDIDFIDLKVYKLEAEMNMI